MALNLLQDEGLVHGEHQFAYDAYQFCVSCKDLSNAKAWMKKAWEGACQVSGSDSEDALKNKRYFDNPASHPAWGFIGGRKLTLEGPDR
jgi:hypothetical protein